MFTTVVYNHVTASRLRFCGLVLLMMVSESGRQGNRCEIRLRFAKCKFCYQNYEAEYQGSFPWHCVGEGHTLASVSSLFLHWHNDGTPDMTLQKVAIVTAASRGMGAACARELAQRGYALALLARSAEVHDLAR